MREKWQKIDDLFHPKSVAIVGASPNPLARGYDYIRGFMEFGFEGDIFPINPKVDEILGLKVYPSIKDVPKTVDYVITCIPAPSVPQLVEECATKGVKVIQLFTAGFSETGEEEGVKLEEELVQRAHRAGIRVIGPNCMGVHYPKAGLALAWLPFAKGSGPVGAISQSGGHSVLLLSSGYLRGIRFSKVISFGNACDLNETDFLEYLTFDPETEIIAIYIEGVKDGQRFINALKRAVTAKPVIITKGGRTTAGTRAVSSHTGALAGKVEMWHALFKQLKVIQVDSIDEMIDSILPFIYFPPLKGRNVGIIGVGGGASVLAADECEREGLYVPPLAPEVRGRLREFTPVAGTSIANPIDTIEVFNPDNFKRTLELVGGWDEIHLLFCQLVIDPWRGEELINNLADCFIAVKKVIDKPVAAILQPVATPKGLQLLYTIQRKLIEAGIPVYPSFARAAKAVNNFLSYNLRG